jgi:predicted PurR-regulated permease PerM
LNGKREYIIRLAIALGAVGIAVLLLLNIVLDRGPIGAFIKSAIDTLMPLLIGFVLAYILNPVLKFFEKYCFRFIKHDKLRRGVSRLVAYLVFRVVVIGLATMVIVQLEQSLGDLLSARADYIAVLAEKISDIAIKFEKASGFVLGDEYSYSSLYSIFNTKINDWLTGIISYITENSGMLFAQGLQTMSVLAKIVIGLIISIYALMSKEKLLAQAKKIGVALFSESHTKYINHILTLAHNTFEKFFVGKVIDSLIIGVIAAIFLTVFRFPYAAIIAIIIGVTNIIPFFGPFIGAIPSALFILIAKPSYFLPFLIFIFLLQQLDGNIIGPRILGGRLGLDTIWIIIAIILMRSLVGTLGMFIGVPIFTIIYVIIKEQVNRRLSAKKLPIELEKYYPELRR